MKALEPVRVSDCRCPNTPHDEGDFVYLSPTIPLRGGLVASDQATARAAEVVAGKQNELENDWLETFVRYGAMDWNLEDAKGDPVPFDVEAVLADYSIARIVAEKANDLGYGTAVLAPFLERSRANRNGAGRKPPRQSRNGRTPDTTSVPKEQTPAPSE